ncbi:TPA: site-specific integrase [Vibrio diabolicus]|uniref:tyrosine-type recombinase/integrase n=1 Tax=Vibrio campbellii TaxID=680 RepID=UPI0021DA685A|nr:site-specific integrase [Vibrio parahaemolyticus]EJG0012345.1 site-specific integrase [Vibrio parahaemolyticus]EJS9798723.1 site-specific integrase [Vibrio parahaemolyticus]MCU8258374.1 site-specific integrase [Vibrio vulnificus]
MARKTKNVIKRELTTPEGVIFYSFVSRITGSIVELEEHINNLILSSQPYNTVKAKASDLAKFYDFYIEASNVLHTQAFKEELTKKCHYSSAFHLRTTLNNIFKAYPSFLMDGKSSDNPLARACAVNLDSTPLGRTSAKRMISSLCDFVTASNALEYSMLQQRKMDGLINVDRPLTAVGEELGMVKELPTSQRKALIENSYLAGCISGGAKVSKIKNFFKLPSETKSEEPKHFPKDSIGKFLLNTKTHRDKCLYALCFGGGLRFSEAAKVRFCDLDVINEEVKLHDKGAVSYLEAIDYKTKSGKSLDHYHVTFIEPFKSFFFEELTSYLEHERAESNSQYVFLQSRSTKNSQTGIFEYQPYYRSANSTIKEAWDLNLKRAGLNTDPRFDSLGTHSMRHYYAHFMTNHAPNPRGSKGYSLLEVQHFIRHKEPKSTKIYTSTIDIEKVREDTQKMNEMILAAIHSGSDQNFISITD